MKWLRWACSYVNTSLMMCILLPLSLLLLPQSTFSEPIVLVRPHGESIHYDTDNGAKYFPKASFSDQFESGGINFAIEYEDMGVGFTDPMTGEALRNRFKEVLVYVAQILNVSSGSLDLQVQASEFDGTGALASAGTFYPVMVGIHPGSTFQRLSSGVKPFEGFPEIAVTVDLGFAWNVPATAPGPAESDFFTVMLHEITHGLGFNSLLEPDGSSSIAPGVYSVYDSLLTIGSTSQFLLNNTGTPMFQASAASLVSDDIGFRGTNAIAQYGMGTSIAVYAPNPYELGSSTSHWDQDILTGPAVMTHAITLGTSQREYSPVDRGALADLGYTGEGDFGVGCNMKAAQRVAIQVAGGDAIVLGVAFLVFVGVPRKKTL